MFVWAFLMIENGDVRKRFEEHVEQIQHLAQMSFYENILSTLIEKAELKPGENVLDAGSGPGWLAIKAARRVGENGKVIGIDTTPGMLEKAKRNASTEGVSQICEFREGNTLKIPFPNRTFDLVLSNFMLHALSEAEKQVAINEFYRVLKPNGRAVVCDAIHSEDAEKTVAEWSKRFPAAERGIIKHIADHLEWNLTSAGKLLEMFSLAGFKATERIEEPEKILPLICIVKAAKQ